MSQELLFAENNEGQWFYLLEHRCAPKDSWDWLEYADCFGPFKSLDEAAEHEAASDSDTSGAEILHYGVRDVGPIAAQLMRTAQIKARKT